MDSEMPEAKGEEDRRGKEERKHRVCDVETVHQ